MDGSQSDEFNAGGRNHESDRENNETVDPHRGRCVLSCPSRLQRGDKPKELLETAEFEERQHNVAHAKQLYEELVRVYPDSKQAETARTRLVSLNQSQ